MSTFLGVVIFVAIFLFVLRVISQKNRSTTLPYNGGTGVGSGGGRTGDGDTGRDEDKFKI